MPEYTNKQIRRFVRKLLEHYGLQNTRKIIELFAKKLNVPKQRIAGNLRAMKYDEKTIEIVTHIPCSFSVMGVKSQQLFLKNQKVHYDKLNQRTSTS